MASVSPGTPDDDRDKKIPQDASSSNDLSVGSATTSTSSPLTRQINEQVTSLETEALTIENSEVQARVRHLIKLIKTSLQSRTLDKKTQRELARLLSLTPTLDGRHAQQLNLLDLAVSILLEPNGSASSGMSGNRGSAGVAEETSANAKNIVFVQETRRQITQQSRPYPDLLRTIFVTGGGTPYIRLISGLGWFFLLFVITPLTVAGVTSAARDIAGFREAQEQLSDLQKAQKESDKEKLNQQAKIERLTGRRDALAAQLGRTNSQIAKLTVESIESSPTTNNSTSDNSAANTPTSTAANNSSPNSANDSSATLSDTPSATDSLADYVLVPKQDLTSIQTEIESELRSNLNRETSSSETSETATSQGSDPEEPDSSGSGSSGSTESDISVSNVIDSWISTPTFSLILLAIAMGALGSTVSVIVRANTFIRQAQENDNDLFLTGFFRPFVGMSFAIFCVALVEAGIFSGIFDLTNRKDTDRTYFYVAIAFVAGFSERLVRDVVIKTEDTIAGPTHKDNHWT